MNSALKPVLAGVPATGGQASPAKANVAGVNHAAVGHPQGANSHHNNLVGQNLTHHAPAPHPPHAPPPMAPVSANMAQMAQNMSHHGNLSHITQNSVGPSDAPPGPGKVVNPNAPLSLVQEKALALTRTPEKIEADSTAQANGTVESPKSGSNAPVTLKAQNPELKDKPDIAKTSPSTPKPPEKPSVATTPQKPETATPAVTPEIPAQPKLAMANEPPQKSPSKPVELKPAPAADVAPSQSDTKPVPESANGGQSPEKAPTPVKQDPPVAESAKVENAVEEKKEEPKVEVKAAEVKKDEPKVEKAEPPKKEEPKEVEKDKPEKVEDKVDGKVEEKKVEVKPKVEAKPKSTLKLATVTPPIRKRRHTSPKATDGPSPAKKPAEVDTPDPRTKRNRTKVQLYQSPTPEIAMATKLSASAGRSTPTKQTDDKLIVIYKNEYMAVRNAEGSFYVCQALQNVYRNTRKIKIRWLSEEKTDSSGTTYKPDFYDVTDMECVLTTLSMSRASGGAWSLKAGEAARALNILTRALQAETGAKPPAPSEEHPDGLDLSLYKDESQLDKKSRKRNSSKSSPRTKDDDDDDEEDDDDSEESETPVKRARSTPKRSPKSGRKAKAKNSKRAPPLIAGGASKTATALSEAPKTKTTPKRTPPVKQKQVTPVTTPLRTGRRAVKETKASPIVPTPSTSTGKTTRTPRKPPAKK